MTTENIFRAFLEAVNEVKNTALSPEVIEPAFHLSGDLGIDSREMLEIWYELEKKLGIQIPDFEKRDLYTIESVVEIIKDKVESQVALGQA
ncbi:acyl carrier protein [Sedimenticola sp.]|uniref:acyl carrier protein n=1 Tax=Sedimenticola sp. TaxID=1940285 RepID=UPI003D0C081B